MGFMLGFMWVCIVCWVWEVVEGIKIRVEDYDLMEDVKGFGILLGDM